MKLTYLLISLTALASKVSGACMQAPMSTRARDLEFVINSAEYKESMRILMNDKYPAYPNEITFPEEGVIDVRLTNGRLIRNTITYKEDHTCPVPNSVNSDFNLSVPE